MIRDQELNRLIKYAEGMGLKVRFKPYIRGGNRAEWITDGTEITVYFTDRCSKLEKILSLIHEIAHNKAFVDNDRSIGEKIDEALDKEDPGKMHRKCIFNMEFNDSLYWEQIYKDTNCKFGLDRLERQRQYDVWIYEYWYETGKWPSWNVKIAKKKELRKQFKK